MGAARYTRALVARDPVAADLLVQYRKRALARMPVIFLSAVPRVLIGTVPAVHTDGDGWRSGGLVLTITERLLRDPAKRWEGNRSIILDIGPGDPFETIVAVQREGSRLRRVCGFIVHDRFVRADTPDEAVRKVADFMVRRAMGPQQSGTTLELGAAPQAPMNCRCAIESITEIDDE